MTADHAADTATGARHAPEDELPERLLDLLAEEPYEDASGHGERIEVLMPFSGARMPGSRRATAEDVEAGFGRARIAQRVWAERPLAVRTRVLHRLHDTLRRHGDLLLDVIQFETGKARIHAVDELLDVLNVCRYYALEAPRGLRPAARHGAIAGLTRTEVTRDPLGTIGFITPWNYPLSLGAADLLAALVAGNAVVHKPDSSTVLTAVLVRRLAIACGLPAELWQLVPGDDDEVGGPLIDGADGLSFTGSTAAGRGIAARAGERLLPTALELGGKNPMLVLEDADLPAAVEGALRGCFSSAGQLCLSIERILVHESVYEEFCTRFAEGAERLRVGPGFAYGPQMGSLAGPRQLERVHDHVEQARAAGSRVLAGGRALPEVGPYFYAPTVLADVPAAARLHGEETFGPVVSVSPVTSTDQAITEANASEYGLSASVYSRRHGREAALRLEVGMVNVNEAFAAAWGSIDAPSGGVKASGLGHRHGTEGLLQFTRARTIAQQHLLPMGPSGLLDQAGYARVMGSAMRVLHALRRR
ncbi:succinic semialdehyde dehydrogenase [Brachybacterium endophyticum]|uniref:Succinic semialdehyde dehydrogenase n=1 Tax=Brachybacterium endophyticum TaxID=2182385 RepID=A0A2U2RPP1_9MICO|nr:succinic semialdehyde dehydrogenase [Brachybacterium endophyticum]PWH07837.1 succinic semialdehyde dehydrogenase [Brachybacterium endophyticum]